MKEEMLYERLPDGRVRCHLCAHGCQIEDGSLGICQVRENQGGTLYTHSYGSIFWQARQDVQPVDLYLRKAVLTISTFAPLERAPSANHLTSMAVLPFFFGLPDSTSIFLGISVSILLRPAQQYS